MILQEILSSTLEEDGRSRSSSESGGGVELSGDGLETLSQKLEDCENELESV